MDSASQGTRKWVGAAPHSGSRDSAPSVLSAFTGPIHGLSSADRPLTSRLLPDGRYVCAVSALLRHLGLPWDVSEAAFLGALSVPRVS